MSSETCTKWFDQIVNSDYLMMAMITSRRRALDLDLVIFYENRKVFFSSLGELMGGDYDTPH